MTDRPDATGPEEETRRDLDALWSSVPDLDPDAVWDRVRAGTAQTPQRG